MKSRLFAFLIVCVSVLLVYGGFLLGQRWLGTSTKGLSWIYWILLLLGYSICSGANVAYFSFSIRDLKKAVERGTGAARGSVDAKRAKQAISMLRHLDDPNWTLASILLTNVAFGVQLSQLSDGLFTGLMAVLMPIISITIFGEFFAQATFLRYAGAICFFFSPIIWALKWATSPISYPLARAVDALYGREAIRRLNEQDLLSDLRLELSEVGTDEQAPHAEVLDRRELTTLMNAAQADDEPARDIGEVLDPRTIVSMKFEKGRPTFPDDISEFIRVELEHVAHPWFVISAEPNNQPNLFLDEDGFVRDYAGCKLEGNADDFCPHDHTFRARVYSNMNTKLGQVISDFQVHEEHPGDDVIDIDVALIWTPDGRWIITGSDILGRFLRGVSRRRHWRFRREERRQRRRNKLSSG